MCGSGRQALVWSVMARRRSRMCRVSQSFSQYGAHRRCVEDGEERVEGVEERKEESLPKVGTLPTYPALARCSPFGPLP